MSERERHVLERIEQHLRVSDPAFVRRFHTTAVPDAGPGVLPRVLAVLGLLLIVVGAATTSVPVAILGIGGALAALAADARRGRATGHSPA